MKNKNIGWRKKFVKEFKRDWQLHLMLVFPMTFLLVAAYFPMYGIQIAFKDFNPLLGISGSEWVGLKWFEKFVTHHQFKMIFSNTVILSLYSIAVGFPLPVIFALFLNAVKSKKFVRFTQTVGYMPHFLTTVIMVSVLNMVLSPVNGIYGGLFRLFGGTGYPVDFRATAGAFRHLMVWSGVWQGVGWSTIIYMAALSSVSQELHEAAMLDGATRIQRIRHIDFPAILPTVVIQLIMSCGSLIGVGFEKTYLMQTSLNLEVSEVISTYIYKTGMGSFNDFSYGAATGLFNTLINLVLVLIVNRIAKKATEGDISLF